MGSVTKTKVIWQKAESLLVFIRQCEFAIPCCGQNPNFSFSLGSGIPSREIPHKCICQMAFKSVQWFKQQARIKQTDGQTAEISTEKCVKIGGIACTVRVISPNTLSFFSLFQAYYSLM